MVKTCFNASISRFSSVLGDIIADIRQDWRQGYENNIKYRIKANKSLLAIRDADIFYIYSYGLHVATINIIRNYIEIVNYTAKPINDVDGVVVSKSTSRHINALKYFINNVNYDFDIIEPIHAPEYGFMDLNRYHF